MLHDLTTLGVDVATEDRLDVVVAVEQLAVHRDATTVAVAPVVGEDAIHRLVDDHDIRVARHQVRDEAAEVLDLTLVQPADAANLTEAREPQPIDDLDTILDRHRVDADATEVGSHVDVAVVAADADDRLGSEGPAVVVSVADDVLALVRDLSGPPVANTLIRRVEAVRQHVARQHDDVTTQDRELGGYAVVVGEVGDQAHVLHTSKVEILPSITSLWMSEGMSTPSQIRVAFRWLRSNERRRLMVFDFDDTLVSSQARIRVKTAEGDTVSISSAQFAHFTPTPGDEVDHGGFNHVVKPRIIKKNWDLFVEAMEADDADVAILTARSSGAETAVAAFLVAQGLTQNLVIKGLASSNPHDKANWIEERVRARGESTYEAVDFYDDSQANAATVAVLEKKLIPPLKKFKSEHVHHPTEADYAGPTIDQVFESTNPMKAVVKYEGSRAPQSPKKTPNSTPWWDRQTEAFKSTYCDEHPNSALCGRTAASKKDSNAARKKLIKSRSGKASPAVKKYLKGFPDKVDLLGDHAGIWLEEFESDFGSVTKKPKGEFKSFQEKDFDDLYWALFGIKR